MLSGSIAYQLKVSGGIAIHFLRDNDPMTMIHLNLSFSYYFANATTILIYKLNWASKAYQTVFSSSPELSLCVSIIKSLIKYSFQMSLSRFAQSIESNCKTTRGKGDYVSCLIYFGYYRSFYTVWLQRTTARPNWSHILFPRFERSNESKNEQEDEQYRSE